MPRVAMIAAATVLGAAASLGAPALGPSTAAQVPDSGIAGQVVLGPTCPVQRAGESCTRPYQATVLVRREPGGRQVARLRSSPRGAFRVALPAGTYLLVPLNGRPFPHALSQTVRVRRHRYAHVVIMFDTGIR